MRENRSSEFPTRSDVNRPVQLQSRASTELEISDLRRREIVLSEK